MPKRDDNGIPTATPNWDGDRRRLRLGDLVVLSFDRVARFQELILTAFEEQSWPRCIDSPLPGGKGAHERLRNAVKKLNRHVGDFLRFHLDGTGQGVAWRLTDLRQTARSRRKNPKEPKRTQKNPAQALTWRPRPSTIAAMVDRFLTLERRSGRAVPKDLTMFPFHSKPAAPPWCRRPWKTPEPIAG